MGPEGKRSPPELGRKTLVTWGGNFLSAAVGLVGLKATALFLGKSVVGEVDGALAQLGILFFLTDLGFSYAHAKRISEGQDEGDCLATFTLFKLFVTGVFSLVLLALLSFGLFLHPGLFQDVSPTVLAIVGAYYVSKSLGSIPLATFQARLESVRLQLLNVVETLVRVALVLLYVLSWGRRPLWGLDPSDLLALSFAGGGVVSSLVGFLYLSKVRWGRFRWNLLRSYATFAIPIFLSSSIGALGARIDAALLSLFGTSAQVGDFTAFRKITLAIETLPQALGALLFPALSAEFSQGGSTKALELARKAVRYSALLVWPWAVGLAVLSKPLVSVTLSLEWEGAIPVFQILLIYTALYSVTVPLSSLLAGVGEARRLAWGSALSSFVLIALNLLLIPSDIRSLGIRLGGLFAVGAALSTVGSGVFALLYFGGVARRVVGKGIFESTGKILLCALLSGATLEVALGIVGPSVRVYTLALLILFQWAVYMGLLGVGRVLQKDDIEFFRRVVHVREVGALVRRELRR